MLISNKTCMFMAPTDKHEIVKCIDSLKNENSSGHDKITASLLKNVKHEIVKVFPIFKAKDKQLLNNYRPISLLPVVSKILEKIVHKRLYGFMNSQNLLFSSQYGFRNKHSTSHGVNEFVSDTIDAFEMKKCTLGGISGPVQGL